MSGLASAFAPMGEVCNVCQVVCKEFQGCVKIWAVGSQVCEADKFLKFWELGGQICTWEVRILGA